MNNVKYVYRPDDESMQHSIRNSPRLEDSNNESASNHEIQQDDANMEDDNTGNVDRFQVWTEIKSSDEEVSISVQIMHIFRNSDFIYFVIFTLFTNQF